MWTRLLASCTALVALLVSLQRILFPADGGTADSRQAYDRAVADFQAGSFAAALRGFASVVATDEPLFQAASLAPSSSDPKWMRYLASVLLISDIRRYHLNDAAGARDVEQRLARAAQHLGYVELAAIEFLAVAEIERFDLDNSAAAQASYGQVVRLAEEQRPQTRGAPVPRLILSAALYGIDQLRAGEVGYTRRLRAIDPGALIEPVSPDLGTTILADFSVYRGNRASLAAYHAFAEAHPRSFRAAFADYTAFAIAVAVPMVGNAGRMHDLFLQRYPNDLLSLAVMAHTLAFHRAVGNAKGHARELSQLRQIADAMGVAVQGEVLEPPPAPAIP